MLFMKVEKVPHYQLSDYLSATGITGVFARYVVEKRPHEQSRAALDGAKVLGVAIAGRDFGLYEAYSHWIFAANGEAARLLAESLKGPEVSVNFPLEYNGLFREVFPGHQFTPDRFYVLNASNFKEASRYEVKRLLSKDLRGLRLEAELKPYIGKVDDWRQDKPLYGVVEDGRLVAIGEATVQAGEVAAIQQVYTLKEKRGQQYGRCVVSHISKLLLAEQKIPTYLVSESNAPSVALAESLGFEIAARVGFVE